MVVDGDVHMVEYVERVPLIKLRLERERERERESVAIFGIFIKHLQELWVVNEFTELLLCYSQTTETS